MSKPEIYTLNFRQIKTHSDLIAVFNSGLFSAFGGCWRGYPDAFNDLVSWNDNGRYQVIIFRRQQAPALLAQECNSGLGLSCAGLETILNDNDQWLSVEFC